MPSNEYRVKSGDTLLAIARSHDVAMDVLARLNGISDLNRIYVGQVLKLPEPVPSQPEASTQPKSHRVFAGETLDDIAQRYEVPTEELRETSGVAEHGAVTVGQVLTLPQKTAAADKQTPQQQSGKKASPQGDGPATNDIMAVAFRITGAFEQGRANSYQNADDGIVSYGKHQATLASGTLGIILQKYVDQSPSVTAKLLSSYMGRVNKKDPSLRDDAGFKKVLMAAAEEPLMGTIQDTVFAEVYWPKAEQGASKDNLHSPLALAMYYDTNIQGGLAAVRESTAKILAGKKYTEAEWLTEFNKQRDLRLKRLAEKRRATAKDKSKSDKQRKSAEKAAAVIEGSRTRVAALQKLVDAEDFQLQGDQNGMLLLNGHRVAGLGAGGGKSSGGSPKQDTPKTPQNPSGTATQVVKPAVINKPSANFSSRGSTDIDAIIVHHTASNNVEQDLVQLTRKGTDVSAHYLLAPDGTIYQLVADDKRAWHAGVSAIRGEKTPDVNSRSIGIEITNDGRGKTPFTEAQYQALEQLVPYLALTYRVPMENILGHRDVAPGRKTDPADNFDWSRVRTAVKVAQSGGQTGGTGDNPQPVTPVPAPSNPAPVSKNFDATLKSWLSLHEGRRAEVYSDSKGHPTVGIGFNLDRDGAEKRLKAIGLDYKAVRAGRVKLTDAQIDALYAEDVKAAAETARSILGKSTYEALNDARKTVVIDMVFNLGSAGFAKFKNMIAALQKADFAKAAREMQDSLWYGQVGYRAQDDVASMRQGQLSWEHSGGKGGSSSQKPDKKPSTPPAGGGSKPSTPTKTVDFKAIARGVHEGMFDVTSVFGMRMTDEDKVYANLAKLNHDPSLIAGFKKVYKEMYGADVVTHINAEFSNTYAFGDEKDRALGYLKAKAAQTPKSPPKGSGGTSPVVLGHGVSIDAANPILVKLATGKLASGPDGSCVTTVRNNMKAMGVACYDSTGEDKNNSRGAMVQMLKNGKWESIPTPESERRKIVSHYGTVDAYVCPGREILKLAKAKQIPLGTVIFQTMYGWDYGKGATGNDVGIVRELNGELVTFNYKWMSNVLVHESAKKKKGITEDDEVVLLVPKGAILRN